MLKPTLNEDESDEDFEKKIMEEANMHGSRKRLRHH